MSDSTFRELNLEMFLPAYSGINIRKNNSLFSFYSDKIPTNIKKEFYPATFLKKEFNDLKLEPIEFAKKPGEPFKPMHHQSFMARFLSPHTPYDRMLVFHEVGSGKCVIPDTIINVNGNEMRIEDIYNSEGFPYWLAEGLNWSTSTKNRLT